MIDAEAWLRRQLGGLGEVRRSKGRLTNEQIRCFHEAGHAVAAVSFGLTVEEVGIVADGGHVRIPDEDIERLCATPQGRQDYAIVCAAGTIAQRKACGLHIRERDDYDRIPAGISEDQAEEMALEWLDRQWDSVSRVADALHGARAALTGERVRDLMADRR